MNLELIAIVLFCVIFLLLLTGYPVAFILGGLSVLVGVFFVPDFLDFLPLRIMGTLQNYVLLAVPLFVFMGLTLEKGRTRFVGGGGWYFACCIYRDSWSYCYFYGFD